MKYWLSQVCGKAFVAYSEAKIHPWGKRNEVDTGMQMYCVYEMLRIKERNKVQPRAWKAVMILRRYYPDMVQLGVSAWLCPDKDG